MAWTLLGASLALAPPAARAAGAAGDADLQLRVIHPAEPLEVDPAEPAFLAGEAWLRPGAHEGLDAVLVIDASGSSGAASDVDLNGDAYVDPIFAGPDSIFAAELVAAERAVEALARPGVRLAVVAFSGRDPARPGNDAELEPARVVQPLTADFERVREALVRLRQEPPRGMTDMAAALARTGAVLAGDAGGRDRVALLVTDGTPTSPHLSSEANLEAALAQARTLAARGIRVHTFAVGEEALTDPEAPILIADLTGGYFTPVDDFSRLAGLAEQVARASVRRVEVRNRTTDAEASELVLDHDGSWSALVPVRPGPNHIAVIVYALGDRMVRTEVVVLGKAGVPPQAIPAELRTQHDAVLGAKLDRMRGETEALRERLRRELARRHERERAERRRSLELSVEQKPTPER